LLRSRQDLALENVALRQQWMVLRRQPGHVRLKDSDRLFWVWLHRLWPGWRQALVLVQPATVVDWHRRGFRAYWRWKSRARGGRPRIDPSVRPLIRHMWSSNPTWGAPRIQAELRKIGIEVSDSTIRRYRPPRVGPSSQTWRSFLDNHLADLAECVLRTPHRIHPQGVPRPRRRAGRAAPTQVLQSAFRQPHHPTLAAPANIRKVRHWTQMRYSLPTPAHGNLSHPACVSSPRSCKQSLQSPGDPDPCPVSPSASSSS
jgi:hypothetical protein